MNKRVAPVSLKCCVCEVEFSTNSCFAKYCSAECRLAGRRLSWRKYRAKNLQDRNEYGRQYYELNQEKVAARHKRYEQTEAAKRSRKISSIRAKEAFPEKVAARSAVHGAILGGYLQRSPCEKCGNPVAEAHHPDYSKPLLVNWLCRKCHRQEHKHFLGAR